MKKKKTAIPDEYFENEEFLLDEINDDLILGVLGPKPSADQVLKFELCSFIAFIIDKNNLSLTDVEKITKINPSDISRIKNHHLDRFTIDRLIKIYSTLDSEKNIIHILKSASDKIARFSA